MQNKKEKLKIHEDKKEQRETKGRKEGRKEEGKEIGHFPVKGQKLGRLSFRRKIKEALWYQSFPGGGGGGRG